MPANMGFASPPPVRQPSAYDRVMLGLLGPSQSYGGLLSSEDQAAAQRNAQLAMAAQLLAAGGPSAQPVSFGQALGSSIMSGQQAQQQGLQSALQAQLMRSQIARNTQERSQNVPSSVQEYEYAKANGFKGSFQDWITAGGQSSRPSAVQEWEFYNGLIEGDKKNGTKNAQLYLEMKRNPNFSVQSVNTVPTVVQPSVVGGTATTALSTPQSEAEAAAEKKRQESAGGALGTAQGNIQGGIETKGANAQGVENLLDIAEPLIDVATGSKVGAAADALSGVFGYAPDGAKAIASLKTLQASLIQNMPRLEGPQSDADRNLYIEAAGQIGDPNVPRDIKRAAVKTVRDIQAKYKERAGIQPAGTPSAKPRRVKVDAQGNIIGN